MKEIISVLLSAIFLCNFITVANADETERNLNRIYVDNAATESYKDDVQKTSRMATYMEYPSSYSSIDAGYITDVKNQGNYGTCWAHGAAASAEASLIKNNGYGKDINISELHLAYFMYNYASDKAEMLKGDSTLIGSRYSRYYNFLDMGGSNSFTPFMLARGTGVMSEDSDNTYNYNNANPYFSAPLSDAYSKNTAVLTEAYWVAPEDIEDMKYMILNYGAGTIAYYHNDSYFKESTSSYYYGGLSNPNHEVTVVGWDDNYQAANFKTKPKNNGAWLVKNSWGEDWGNKGYFWLSYEDKSLISDVASFYGFKEATDENVYQYDGSSSYDYEENDNYCLEANIFTSNDNEYLNSISFWTAQKNTEYSIQIYQNLKDKTIPTSGQKALSEKITGSAIYAGYHTININTSIFLKKGETFSIVISLNAKNQDKTFFFVDRSDASAGWIVFTNKTNNGQSFLKIGDEWVDKSSYGINYRIKAFTSKAEVDEDTETDIYNETDTQEPTTEDENTDSNIEDSDNFIDTEIELKTYSGIRDVSGDGVVNMLDVVCVQKAIARIIFVEDVLSFDINNDKILSMIDVVILQKHIAGLL